MHRPRAPFLVDVDGVALLDSNPHVTSSPLWQPFTLGRVEVRAQSWHLVGELATLTLAYLHSHHIGDDQLLRSFRDVWPTALLRSFSCANTMHVPGQWARNSSTAGTNLSWFWKMPP